MAASEKAQEREIMSVSMLCGQPPQPWPSTLPLLQVWCDIPKVKRTRTAAEEEEELAGRDMSSLEVNYV